MLHEFKILSLCRFYSANPNIGIRQTVNDEELIKKAMVLLLPDSGERARFGIIRGRV